MKTGGAGAIGGTAGTIGAIEGAGITTRITGVIGIEKSHAMKEGRLRLAFLFIYKHLISGSAPGPLVAHRDRVKSVSRRLWRRERVASNRR